MCGRAKLEGDVEIKIAFRVPPDYPTPNFPPSWNVAPTDSLPVVRYDAKAGQRSLEMLRWGMIPYWAKDIKVARDGSVRPLSFRTARRLVSKRRGPDRRGCDPCRRRTAPNFAWSGNGNALPGDRARRSRPGARQPLGWSEGATAGPPSSPSGNPIWSVADIDPLHGVFGG